MMRWLRDPQLRLPVLAGAGALGIAVVLGLLTGSWTSTIMLGVTFFVAVVGVALVRMLIQNERKGLLRSDPPPLVRPLQSVPASPPVAAPPPSSSVEQQLRTILRDLRSRRGGAAHELPWLLVLGAPGSGKTQLIGASGLEVPASYVAPHVAPGDPELVRTNDAVLIEAPGTWVVDGGDHECWHTLLGLLRKHRPRCPLNGVIVTVSVPWLLRSSTRLEEAARALRRRLNEARVELGVDAPVYIVLTQADALDGFAETAQLLPRSWLAQAFGWTNDLRNLPDAGKSAGQALEGLAERMDRLLPELLLRAPDPAVQRALFGCPQELAALAQPLAGFVGATFARDAFAELAPFLRGVYLTSARVQGASLSSTLQRLRLTTPPRQANVVGPLFVRELVFNVIRGDTNVAVVDARIGPLGQRAILGAAALAALWVVVVWGLSFAQNLTGTKELARLVESVADSRAPTLDQLALLRKRVEDERARAASPIQWIGFNRLADSSESARRQYVRSFHASFDRDLQKTLAEKLKGENQEAVQAVLALSKDLRLLSQEDGDAPDVAPYRPPHVKDAALYQEEYKGFVSLLSKQDAEALREERQPLRRTAETLLQLTLLEKITLDPASSLGPERYEDFGLESSGETPVLVEGIYTPEGYAGLVEPLLGSIAARGGGEGADSFRRQYLETYRRRWKDFLMGAAIVPSRSKQIVIVKSPYVRLIERADEALLVASGGSADREDWIVELQTVRRTGLLDGPSTEEGDGDDESVLDWVRRTWNSWRLKDPLGKKAPWSLYVDQLQLVEDAVKAKTEPEAARALALNVAANKETPFSIALAVVRKDVLPEPETDFERQLQALLEAPILNGMSFVLENARGALNESWKANIQSKFGKSQLSPLELKEMCAARAALLQEDLGQFVGPNGPRRLPGGRALQLGPKFVGWVESTRSICGLAGDSLTLQVRGGAFKVVRPAGFTRSATLAISCASGQDIYEYTSGSEDHRFLWKSDCQEVVLRTVVSVDGRNEEIAHEPWRGPLAVSDFLKAGGVDGRARTQVGKWRIQRDGIVVEIAFTILAGTDLARIQYTPPPASLGD